MAARLPFESLYAHGFLRIAACTPRVEVAQPAHNLQHTLLLARAAHARHAALAVFPELGISAYTNDDLFFQDALLDAVMLALGELIEQSRGLAPVIVVGAPLRLESRLFNCAVVVHGGRLLGVVPKSYLPGYREFYEKRQFSSARDALRRSVTLHGQSAAFGNDLLFEASADPAFTFCVELCEDLWVPTPPSSAAALAGALILVNLSASDVTIGKADYRRLLCASQSGRCVAAYAYAAAGPGESTTDLAWDGHAMLYENAELLAESGRFAAAPGLITADIDLERLVQERSRLTSFNDAVHDHAQQLAGLRRVPFYWEPPQAVVPLEREIPRFPYVPADTAARDERCHEVYCIQTQGLATRLAATGIRKLVLGVSGGLDSTQAALVCARTADQLGLPRSNVLGCLLPGFATSMRAGDDAAALVAALGFTRLTVDIRPATMQLLADIGHPHARGEPLFDVTFENAQAGARAAYLFRLANLHTGLVVGTSDLSELALGYTTYGVGDHMAHYHVNASVPKTLLRHLVRWAIGSGEFTAATGAVLESILAAPSSAELVPGPNGRPAPTAEATVGPYELQDFNLYYLSRYGYRPSKVAFLALAAWRDAERGRWPESLRASERNSYSLADIRRWLEVFIVRFFQQSQFKRSALPNAPKVGSGGSLSPRSDWRAPSDAHADVWLAELHAKLTGQP